MQTETDIKNAATSAREVEKFRTHGAPFGVSYIAYLSRSDSYMQSHPIKIRDVWTITTWTGDKLADVIAIKNRRERRGYTTSVRGSFWARGIDGRLYYGTHNGECMYCRMRLAKDQSARRN